MANQVLENIDRLKQILSQPSLNPMDKALAQKLLLEIYEEITFLQPSQQHKEETQDNTKEIKIEEPLPKQEKIKEEELETIVDEKNKSESPIEYKEKKADIEEVVPSQRMQEEEKTEEEGPVATHQHSTKKENEPIAEQDLHSHKTTDNTQSQSTLSDLLAENKLPTVYDLLKDLRNNTDLVTKLANQPITNIAKAITLNDKLMFIKELFGGDADTYNEAIARINKASNLEEALSILAKYNIDTTKESAGLLIRVLYRRFED